MKNRPSFWIQSSWRGDQTLEQICQRATRRHDETPQKKTDTHSNGNPNTPNTPNTVGLYALFGSWNAIPQADHSGLLQLLDLLLHPHARRDTQYATGRVQVDSGDDELEFICENNTSCADNTNNYTVVFPCPPPNLPVLVLLLRRASMKEPEIRYLSALSSEEILAHWRFQKMTIEKGEGPGPGPGVRPSPTGSSIVPDEAKKELQHVLESFGLGTATIPRPPPPLSPRTSTASSGVHAGTSSSPGTSMAVRIFIAGDRMSVGKTSVCLGLLGSLIRMGYQAESLAYIKPATQNEKPQLVQHYCDRLGIECVSIGPIVYYRGFTRAFLEGETESSEELLAKVEEAVDKVAQGKQIVIVDGVGFPAVGSICGTDNASVARASGYPMVEGGVKGRRPAGVVLVGGQGVGGAVDAFNLNATYFERARVPVLGAIFNKLSLEGFYSLENCRSAITSYFAQNEYQQKLERKAFGFVPLFPGIAGGDENSMKHVFDYIKTFQEHVDIPTLLDAATKVQDQSFPVEMDIDEGGLDHLVNNHLLRATVKTGASPTKRVKVTGTKRTRSREEIEQEAVSAGAAPSA